MIGEFGVKNAKIYYILCCLRKESAGFLWYVALVCFIRPTAAITWLPLCLYHIKTSRESAIKNIFLKYLPIGIVVGGFAVAIDYFAHGSLIFTPIEFLKVNVFNEIGSFYGSSPWLEQYSPRQRHKYFSKRFFSGTGILQWVFRQFLDYLQYHSSWLLRKLYETVWCSHNVLFCYVQLYSHWPYTVAFHTKSSVSFYPFYQCAFL